MKNLLFSFIVFFVTSINLSAQSNHEDLLKEMEKMQEEMKKQFENLELNFGDAQFLIDTIFIQKMEPFEFNSGNLSEIMDILQNQMRQMESFDWEEMEELFKPFGEHSPAVPAPENFDEQKKEQGDIIKKSNKNRKSYSL